MTENNLNNQSSTIWDQLTKGIEELKAQLESKDEEIKNQAEFIQEIGELVDPTAEIPAFYDNETILENVKGYITYDANQSYICDAACELVTKENEEPLHFATVVERLKNLKNIVQAKDEEIQVLKQGYDPNAYTKGDRFLVHRCYYDDVLVEWEKENRSLDIALEELYYFINRVDKGSIISKTTYTRYKDAIQRINEIRQTSNSGKTSIWTKEDYEIKSLIYKLLEKAGYKSDVLGLIGSWKDTVSSQEILEDLKKVMEFNTTTEEPLTIDSIPQDAEINVCDECGRACCWHGEFMCAENKTATTRRESIKSLREKGLEHTDYILKAYISEYK